ncbi:MAG: bacteriochlorophyll/chlorophyll a synthase [Methanomassiliicoccales archaeon PtaU1.Bin124]|nr:MAG: bacteriochlorophyll/chlorophyll a synthase [Methanomassiliicoccales archaeon PtaU1.Bin124]
MGVDGATVGQRFVSGVDRIRDIAEKERLPLALAFLYVIVLATIRDLSEYYLLDPNFVNTAHPWIFSIAHHVAFYVVVYLGLVLLLAAFSGRGLRKAIAFITFIYALILVPPILDKFLFGVTDSYSYYDWTEFINAILHFSGTKFHPGQGIEVVLVLFAMGAYIFWCQRDKLDRQPDRIFALTRLGLFIVFALAGMFFLATPAAYLPVGFTEGIAQFPNYASTRYNLYHLYLLAYYLLVAAALTFVIGVTVLRKNMVAVARSMRPLQTAFFAAILLAGMTMGWTNVGDLNLVTHVLDPPYWANLGPLGVSVIAALMIWQSTTIWNDVADLKMDLPTPRRSILVGAVPLDLAKQMSYCLAIAGVLLAFLLSWTLGLIAVVILFIGWAYSYPPLRLKEQLLRPLTMGIGTFLAFLFGYLTPYGQVNYVKWQYIGPYLTGNMLTASLSMTALEVGLCMLVGLFVGSMVTDVDGYSEDKKGGVKTVYTIIGIEKGASVVSVLIFFSSLLPLFLFQTTIDLVFFPTLGVLAAILFKKYLSSKVVMLVAFVGLVYAALRLLGLI